MTAMKEAAAEFLSHRRVAVTGVSRTPANHGSNVVQAMRLAFTLTRNVPKQV